MARPGTAWLWLLVLGCSALGLGSIVVPGVGGSAFYHSGALLAVSAAWIGVRRLPHRRAWAALAGGLALFEVGDMIWDFIRLTTGDELNFSPADGPWTAAYVAYGFGIWLVMRGRGLVTRAGVLDWAILGGSIAIALWHFTVTPAASEAGSMLERSFASAYPLLDLLLLAAALWVVVAGDLKAPAIRLLAAHLALLSFADLAWVTISVDGAWARALDALYLPTYALLGAAALHPSAERLSGEIVGRHVRRGRLMLLGGAMLTGPTVAVAVSSNGVPNWGLLAGSATLSTLIALRFVGLVVDTEKARRELERAKDELGLAHASLEELSRTDPLTGLANRRALTAHLDRLLRSGPTALCFLDLDRFKIINDSLGHRAGDELLIGVARRLEEFGTRGGALCARLGGDEFVVAVPAAHAADAMRLGEQIIVSLAAPIDFEGNELFPQASVGAAFGAAGDSPEMLLRDADIAMYAAKTAGRNQVVLFDARMQAAAARRFSTEASLRRALEHEELLLHFQPIVAAAGCEVAGFEAVLRWDRGGRLLPAEEFLEVAEDSGLIVDIGEWVLRAGCAQLAAWGPGPGAVFVNLSGRELRSPMLVRAVQRALASSGAEPSRLVLEVAENAIMTDPESAERTLRELAALGVRLAIDDFGAGYSSLAHLHHLPLDIVKLDPAFSDGLVSRGEDGVVVSSLVQLVHGLGRTVILKGIEDGEHRRAAAASGADWVQGFHIGHPVEASAVPGVATRIAQSPVRTEAPATT